MNRVLARTVSMVPVILAAWLLVPRLVSAVPAGPHGTAGDVRIRKSVTSADFSAAEKAQVRDAFLALKAAPEVGDIEGIAYSNTYDKFVAIHLAYFDMADFEIHMSPDFLPWHRWFLLEMENAMRTVDADGNGKPDFPDVTIPYWDWTVDDFPIDDEFLGGDGVDADDDIVDTGPFAYKEGNWDININDGDHPTEPGNCPDVTGTPEALRRGFSEEAGLADPGDAFYVDAQEAALALSAYDAPGWNEFTDIDESFRSQVEYQLHNSIHRWVGGVNAGNMYCRASPNDPVFWLHHANLDRVWCLWQETYPDVEHYLAADAAEAFEGMNGYPGVTPFDVLNIRALGYRYDDCIGPPEGACCGANECDEQLTKSQCLLLGRTYRGDGVACTGIGVCCDRINGICNLGIRPCDCPLLDWAPGTCATLEPACIPPGEDAHMIVLLDRTGSMLAARNGSTRCADALETAIADVEAFFLIHEDTRQVAVWTFSGDGPTDITGGFVGKDDALAALALLSKDGCDGITPLAESICEAADFFPGGLVIQDKILAVSSDGGENNSDGDCEGPWSAGGVSCGAFDAGSWQELVCDHIEDAAVVQARFWGAIVAPSLDVEKGTSIAGGVPDATFFQAIARATGGGYFGIDDADRTIPGPPVACRLADGSCLDGLDATDCHAAGGQVGWPFMQCPPSLCDVDSDRDGVVDCLDGCPKDGQKTEPGWCGCGDRDYDSDRDGIPDCADRCPSEPDPPMSHERPFETPRCPSGTAVAAAPRVLPGVSVGPNPFGSAVTIRFRLPAPGVFSVSVYDVRGQLVRAVVEQASGARAGEYEVTWDGTNARGMRMPSGTYFYRVVTPSASWTGKIVMAMH